MGGGILLLLLLHQKNQFDWTFCRGGGAVVVVDDAVVGCGDGVKHSHFGTCCSMSPRRSD